MSVEHPRTHWRGAHEQPLRSRPPRRRVTSGTARTIILAGAFAALAIATYTPPRSPADPDRAAPAAGAYFPNCDAARAAGAAPLLRHQPGYRTPLAADLDGIACEPLPGL